MQKIEHIGIAVKSIEAYINMYEQLLDTSCYKLEAVESEGVKTAFFKVGPNKIELLEATRPDSPIAKFIEKKGEGIHHIAYAVTNVSEEMERLKRLGFELLNQSPKSGADNKEIVFLHPKSAGGVLVELCSDRSA
ncbi:MAG TPA: methylmalonyl-CoA epimerase [Flavobacteriales bacterium]|nr:methylmalonyl-CoA epimerase [Flavobacteriales bacterium]